MKLSGWGRYPVLDCNTATCRDAAALNRWLDRGASMIARGNGRAYGDAALNPELTLSLRGLDRLHEFDPSTGRVTCEAGVLLDDLLSVFVPRGWFPPVVPGTKFVTVGGMVATDVHGKNHHHEGGFGRYVERLELVLADGTHVSCGPDRRPDLFQATLGGMGLTGVITAVTFRMKVIETAFLHAETLAAPALETAMALFEASQAWPYTVAWVDCLASGPRRGRALLYRGRHLAFLDLPAEQRENPLPVHRIAGLTVPTDVPAALLNGTTVRLFNRLYYAKGSVASGASRLHYDSFFFPLDNLFAWNRLYGRRGFTQYQCVLPKAASKLGLEALLDRIAAAGQGSFLGVLKLLGAGNGWLSFPMEGYTLALDFPIRPGTLTLLNELDAIVADHGGRVYLAKDARTTRRRLEQGYDQLASFEQVRHSVDPNGTFASALSRRLQL